MNKTIKLPKPTNHSGYRWAVTRHDGSILMSDGRVFPAKSPIQKNDEMKKAA